MEESYGAVGLAIFRLVADSGEEAECLKSQAILRCVLQRHPVVRGFALSTLARRLREGATAGNQPSRRHRASAGASAEARVPHTGIRLALEVLLASYHPSASHVVSPVVDALGDSNLEGGTSPLLPWAARLCLLHACLAGTSAGSKRWRWLPTVADSACSLALQEIATEGSSSVSGSEAGKGKGRARGHGAKSAPTKEIANRVAAGTDKAEMYQATLMADVCTELARVEVAEPAAVSTKKSGFLFGSLGTTPDDVARISSAGAAASLPGRHAADSFRLKLQGLRDALLSRRGSEGNAPVGQSVPSVTTIIGDVALEDLDIHPQAVKRALERGRCGEAFILAVQAALKEQLTPTSTTEAKDQQFSSNRGRRISVNLKLALETCLFGSGLAGGRGLLDAVVPDGDEIGFTSTSSSTRAKGTTEARQACALMQGLVEEGTRIRDLLLVLVGMYQERERLPPTSSPAISMDSGRLAGAQAPFMVSGKRRFSQVGGKELWGLLQGACLVHEEKMPASLIVRTAAAVVTASRKTCQSRMVSPGLLGSSPIRVVIDMLTAAKDCLTASDLLTGLLEVPGDDGPALAADVFAAFIAASAAGNGRTAGGDNEVGDLRSLSMSWLHGALATAVLPVRTPAGSTVELNRVMSATALTRVLIQRVPFEAKPVLLAVEEAAELATAGRGVGGCTRRSGKSRRVSGRGGGENLDGDAASPLASLLKLAGAAKQSRLLPLPVPSTVSPPRSAGLKCGEASGAGAVGAGIPTTLPAGSGDRKVAACLLVGFLVESGVPGWDETKAAMTPPPPQLLVAAEESVRTEGESHVWHSYHSRQQLTALRLEVMLQSLLCDVGGSRLIGDMDVEKSFPDVFRTARTLARAIAHHASALVTRPNQGQQAWRTNDYHRFQSGGGGFEGVDPHWPSIVGGSCSRGGEGAGNRQLKLPRRALAGRLQHSPAAAALTSWVSSIVKTVRQFRRWLPWQPLADELRELVLRNARRKPVRQLVSGGERNETQGRTLAAEAAVFAVSELLLAWDEGGEEVVPAVFQSVLCSKALNIAVAPVASDAPPPIWLELLRCLVDEGQCDMSGWMSSCLDGSAQQDPLAMASAAAVWIGGDGPRAGQRSRRGTHEAWVHWYGAKLGSLIPTGDADFGDWLILSSATGASASGGVQVRVEGLARTIQPDEWEHWGRSPLQAAWNFPGTWAAVSQRSESQSSEGAPPAILLPPFASWLRVVLRGGSTCPKHLLEAYLRRMALEVYLPCQFGRASNEMARQWLAVLIEAEATAEGSGRKRAKMAADAVVCDWGSVTADPSSGSAVGMVSACHLVVKAFFREELLRFGSGEAPAAPNGGPMSWLWPLEAVVAACGNNGSFGRGSLARRRRGSLGPEGIDSDASSRITLDGPPSALARALSTVPHDLLCGSRRFGMGGQPPPALATLRAFATRVVDLTARALATPPCRHWSVARQLLLGLGLLYHALAKPVSARGGKLQKSFGAPSRAGDVELDSAAQEAAQAVALSAIEGLVRISLGLGNLGVGERDSGEGGNRGSAAASKSGNPLLTSACLALRPLETGGCAGADDFARALMGAGAWRAETAFFGERSAAQASSSVKAPSLDNTAPALEQTASLALSLPPPPPPLSPQAGPEQGHRLSSPGATPAVEPHHSVGGDQASGQSTADCCISLAQELVGGAQQCSSGRGEREQVVGSPRAPSWDMPSRQKKKARLSTNAMEGKSPPPSSPRRVLPMRSSKQQHHHEGSES
ncbi:expressed unknown protein [Ectocarpus siliculosus]|uniref:Uncharacterized protein n=1 Tax=Ectocarpus siliculosus TaxID=2880 RepID=D8LQJ3_ECTSI|nr:expressed unknown protein [Ectocarpus siliculosus]|eukprot:CBN78757.1 expressed unknown protein [Ectocarpus siliculosus]